MQNNADHNGLKTVFRYIADGNLQTIKHFQKINLDANYDYRLSDRWLLGAAYRFEILRSSEPKSLIAQQNFFNVKISYLF